MADYPNQAKLNLCSIAVSKVVGDEVSLATSDGNLFSAQERLSAINRARGTVYTTLLNRLGMRGFLNLYPEFIGNKTKQSVNNIISDKGNDVRVTIKLYCKNIICEGIPAEQIYNAKYDEYSTWKATDKNPKFVEQGQSIMILGFTLLTTDNIDLLYLKQPVDIPAYSATDDDLIEPYIWLQAIINEAVINLFYTKQKQLPSNFTVN